MSQSDSGSSPVLGAGLHLGRSCTRRRRPARRAYTYPRISPDGRRIALNAREANRGRILVWDTARDAATPLLSGPGESDLYLVCTVDGEHLAYMSGVSSRHHFRLLAVGNAGPGEPIAGGFELRAPYFLSSSGTELVYARQGPQWPTDDVALWMTGLGRDAEPVRLLGGARNADLSPGNRFIVYQANQTGRFEVYVRSFPNIEDQHVKVSTAGGIQPVWSPRNDGLFYVEPGSPSHLMSVSVDAGSGLVVSRPLRLLEWPYFQGELGRTYDVSRPGGGAPAKTAAPRRRRRASRSCSTGSMGDSSRQTP